MKNLLVGLFVVFSLFLTSPIVNAQNAANVNTGFSTQDVSENAKKTTIKNIDLKILSNYDESFGITCFDVGNNGQIAVGLDHGTNKSIYVFDRDGKFDRGYNFSSNGSFNLEWDGENILIYIVRGDLVVSVDRDGKVTDVLKIENTSENNSYWNKLRSSKNKTVDGKTYLMKNNIGIFNFLSASYSQMIVKIGEDETVIYDASAAIIWRKIFIIIIVALIILVTIYSVIRRFWSKSVCLQSKKMNL